MRLETTTGNLYRLDAHIFSVVSVFIRSGVEMNKHKIVLKLYSTYLFGLVSVRVKECCYFDSLAFRQGTVSESAKRYGERRVVKGMAQPVLRHARSLVVGDR